MKVILTSFALLAMAATLSAAPEDAAKGEGKPPRGEGKPPAGKGGPGRGDPAAAFAKMDTDGDGKISKEEFLATPMGKKDPEKAATGFTRRDKDSDGFLSKEEMGPPSGGRPPGAGGDKGPPPSKPAPQE